jgi:hypothetical protein
MPAKRLWLVLISLALLGGAGCCRACHRFCPPPAPAAPVAYAPAPAATTYCVPCVPCCPTTAGAPPAPVPAVPASQSWNLQGRAPVIGCCPCP